MAKSNSTANIIGAFVLIAAALLLYFLWKNGVLTKLMGGSGSSSASNTAGSSGYTGNPSQQKSVTATASPTTASTSASGKTYTVQSGNTLSGIAAQFGVSLSSLLSANPQISNPNLIYPNQVIHLPSGATQQSYGSSSNPGYHTSGYTTSSFSENPTQEIAYMRSHGGATPTTQYKVQSGQNLSTIAAAHNLSLAQIEALNPQISNPNLIYPNEEVNV